MGTHTHTLWQLATELVATPDIDIVRAIAQASPFEYNSLVAFDHQLGGPSMGVLSAHNSGLYDSADRDVFRPLQYCSMFLEANSPTREWMARECVHMAGLHLESLVKHIGSIGPIPLGTALHKLIVSSKLDPILWQQMVKFAKVYNAAKHDVNHPKDTHLFSVEDAILAYVIARQQALQLYPLVKLKTDLAALAVV